MPYRAELDLERASTSELITEVLTLRSDLAMIAAEFVREANDRGWCGDYERWARIINRQLSRPHFLERSGHEERDPQLDETGRFSIDDPGPTASAFVEFTADGRRWCAACNTHH